AFSTNFAFSRWRASVADEPSPRDRKETDPEVAATAQQLSGLSVNGQVNEAASLNHQDEQHAHENKHASSRDELAADLVEQSANQIAEPFMQHGHQQPMFYPPHMHEMGHFPPYFGHHMMPRTPTPGDQHAPVPPSDAQPPAPEPWNMMGGFGHPMRPPGMSPPP